jgi:phage head maturation protease
MKHRIFAGATIKATGEPAQRTFLARITSGEIDREGEVVQPEGMDASEFLKTSTIFWNHDYDRPIGKATSIKKNSGGIDSDAQIAARPADYVGEFWPDFVWAMIAQGLVKGVSIGFDAIDRRLATAGDRGAFGPDCKSVVSKWKLLEWSIAPLQCNTDAVILAVQKGLVKPEAAKIVYPKLQLPKKRKKTFLLILMPLPAVKREPTAAELATIEVKKRRGALYG